jgi:hypothetical protein
MNKIILKYGILGGIAASIIMSSMTIYMKLNPEKTVSMFLGMFTMILAYTFIVLGVLKLRKENNDTITLGKAFLCGLGIVFITSTIYVLVWLIIYYNFFPNFMEHYCDLALKQTPPEELVAKKAEMEEYKEMYKSPIGVILLTYMEIFPFGIVVALINAAVLKKK